MPQVLIQPGNPLALEARDLEDLIGAIADLDSTYEVKVVSRDQVGHQVTLWEVLTIWLPDVLNNPETYESLMRVAIGWVYQRFEKKQKEQNAQAASDSKSESPTPYRPKSVTILGPNGEVLKSVVVRSPHEDPEDDTAAAKRRPVRGKPKGW